MLEAGSLYALGCESLFLRFGPLGSETNLLGGCALRCKSSLLGLGLSTFFGETRLFAFRSEASFFGCGLSTLFGDALLFAFRLLGSFRRETLLFGFGAYRCVTLFLRLDSFGGESGLFRLGPSPLLCDARLFEPNLLGALGRDFFFFEALSLFGLPTLFFEPFFLESDHLGRGFDAAALDGDRHEITKTRDGDVMR